ncbi:MAG: cardiolipin synthase [Enterococcus sp.]|jgi:cardiolipin synthase|nr:cardiolipin synthase [Enterococcus sp.]
MKNKLQQMLFLTFVFIGMSVLIYLIFDSFLILTVLIEILSILISGYLIFFDERNSTSKFAWLFAILILPFIGILLFILIGRNPKTRRFTKVQKENIRKLHKHLVTLFQQNPEWKVEDHFLSKELFFLSGNYALKKNELCSLADGETAYQAILNDIRKARHHIHLFFFIYKADETGIELAEVLKEKATQGIEVRFMYDSVGSIKLPYQFIDQLKEAGVEVRPFDLVNSPLLSTRINWRNHRKMVIIDGEIAHIGGMNLGNEYRSLTNKFTYWRDTNLRIKGPATLEVQAVFLHDWIYFENEVTAITPFLEQSTVYFPTSVFNHSEEAIETCQIVFGGPYDEENIIRDAFMDSIGKATTSIKIASPYFVPDEEALSAIRRAARSGIQVQVMMPGKGDRAISYYGNTSFINRLLSAGVEVYFYDKEAFLHCKYMIIDDQVATIGSTNFDVRSFYLNHEISAFIYGPSQAVAEIVQQFTTDLARCEQVTLSQRARRPISQRVKEKLSEFFAPLL